MEKFLNPKSIVVVGASETEANMAKFTMLNLRSFKFKGDVIGVGARPGRVFGFPIVDSFDKVDTKPDFGAIMLKPELVPDAVEALGELGVKRLVVMSSGFSEYSGDRSQLEDRIKFLLNKYDMRMIGPNCLGVIHLTNGLMVPFTPFIPDSFKNGPVGIISQSGSLGTVYAKELSDVGIGIRTMVSVGNKLDIDETDVLRWMIADPEIELVFMYLEGINRGRELIQAAMGAKKPILIHKSNIGPLSEGIASSHTTALLSDDAVVNHLFDQANIIRVTTLRELVDLARAFHIPRPKGPRVAGISMGGGHAVITADACQANGLDMPQLPPEIKETVENAARAGVISVTNPMDLGDVYNHPFYRQILEEFLTRPQFDSIVFTFWYSREVKLKPEISTVFLGDMALELMNKYQKPIYVNLTASSREYREVTKQTPCPIFPSPVEAVRALRQVLDWANRDKEMEINGAGPDLKPDLARAEAVIKQALDHKADALSPDKIASLLDAYGIPRIPSFDAETLDQALAAAEKIGYPVALKIISPQVTHKTEAGGVILGILDAKALEKAWDKIQKDVIQRVPDAEIRGISVQKMASDGVEILVGLKFDPQFGPVIVAGAGGVLTELIGDVSMALAPVTTCTARKMISSLKVNKLLCGFRGRPAADIDALVDVIVRLSRLGADLPRISEMDLNPLIVNTLGLGAKVVDARVMLKNT